MRILLLDHNYPTHGQTAWQKLLETELPDVMVMCDSVDDTHVPKNIEIVFLHTYGREQEWLRWQTAMHPMPRIIEVSGGLRPRDRGYDCWHGCYWHPDEFRTQPEAQEFLEHLRRGTFVPELLQPRRIPTAVLAYLLAEHYDVMNFAPSDLRARALQEFKDRTGIDNASLDRMKRWFQEQNFQ